MKKLLENMQGDLRGLSLECRKKFPPVKEVRSGRARPDGRGPGAGGRRGEAAPGGGKRSRRPPEEPGDKVWGWRPRILRPQTPGGGPGEGVVAGRRRAGVWGCPLQPPAAHGARAQLSELLPVPARCRLAS